MAILHGKIEAETEKYIYAKIQELRGASNESIGILSTKSKPCEIMIRACRNLNMDENMLYRLHPETVWILLSNGKLTCRISSGLKQTELTNPAVNCEWIPTRSFNKISSYSVNDGIEGAVAIAIQTRNPEIVDKLMQGSFLDDFTMKKLAPVIHSGKDDHLASLPNVVPFHKRGSLAEAMTVKQEDRNKSKTRNQLIEQGNDRNHFENTGSEESRFPVQRLDKILKEMISKNSSSRDNNTSGNSDMEPSHTKDAEAKVAIDRVDRDHQSRPKLQRLHGIDTVDIPARKEYSLRKNKNRKTI